MMYDELVKALRICAEGEHCDKCTKWEAKQNGGLNACQESLCTEAADAIEELRQIAGHYEETAHDYFKDVCYYLERVPKWIPVAERLPDEVEDVLIYGEWTGASGTKYREIWLTDMKSLLHQGYKPIAWMPLPERPEEEQT